ncbi:hypothetical protein CHRYSEO8AT_290049 [Chryseobacterium sp. 8AT]|nr:hypothetical protein CHRYSEO8AT_290049 [Chryseobacterium sp. 8AT]
MLFIFYQYLKRHFLFLQEEMNKLFSLINLKRALANVKLWLGIYFLCSIANIKYIDI